MPYIEALEFEYPLWKNNQGERQLKELVQGRLENPYRNYLHLLEYLRHLTTHATEEELERFADCGDLSLRNPGSSWSRYALLLFQTSSGEQKHGWYDFSSEAYTDLLQEPLLQDCFDGQSFCNLDYFLTGLAELRVLECLPDDTDGLRQVWIEEGLIDFYWQNWPLRKILARACQLKGWQWFCQGTSDPIERYRNGLVALLSLQAETQTEPEVLKSQFIHLHDELVIQAASSLEKPELKNLRILIQEAIEQIPEI